MIFYENEKKVRYNPYNMKYLIGSGNEVCAYKVGEEVVKFYKEHCTKLRMDKETAEALTHITTNRILTPTKILLDKKNKIGGYKMKYISSLGEDSFYKLNRKDLSREMAIIHNDIITISDHGCLMDDLNIDNTIFSNGIYLIDPGSFEVKEKYKRDNIKTYGINIDRFNDYLVRIIYYRAASFKENDSSILNNTIKIFNANGGALNYMISGIKSKDIDKFIKTKVLK